MAFWYRLTRRRVSDFAQRIPSGSDNLAVQSTLALPFVSAQPAVPRHGGGLGLARALQREPLAVFTEMATKGDLVEIVLPYVRKKMFFVNSPALAEEVLIGQHRIFKKTMHGYKLMKKLLGDGLVTAEGEAWKRTRQAVQPAFHRAQLMAMGARMGTKVEAMLASWRAQADPTVNLHEEMMHLTLSIVGEALLSSDLGAREGTFSKALDEILSQMIWRSLQPIPLPLAIPTPANRRFVRAKRALDSIILEVIRKRREPKGDLLDMLIDASLDEQQLLDEVMTMFFAGHETTATALTWVFTALAENPAAEARLTEEIAGRSLGELVRLPYLNAVLKETLRLYAPVWIIPRAAEEATELEGVAIPKGAYVFLSPYLLQRREAEWKNATAFQPERWLDPAMKPRQGSYLPFLQGARKCIGEHFALMEMAIVTGTMLQRLRMTRASCDPVELLPQITLKPRGGMPMRLRFL